jgi:hypothetical protein
MLKKLKNKIVGVIRDLVKVKIKGEHFVFHINPKIKEGSSEFKKIGYAINQYVRKGKDDLLNLYSEQGLVKLIKKKENLLANTGKNVFARLLTGDVTYSGEITYGALGNGASPSFSSADTQLNSEVGRKAVSDAAYDGSIAYIDFFFASGDIADGTYTEWATFIDGTASADSGQAFSLLATGDWVKSGSIYISSKYTIV